MYRQNPGWSRGGPAYPWGGAGESLAARERLETPEQWIRLGTEGFSPRRDGTWWDGILKKSV
jgi:hypothetical protein